MNTDSELTGATSFEIFNFYRHALRNTRSKAACTSNKRTPQQNKHMFPDELYTHTANYKYIAIRTKGSNLDMEERTKRRLDTFMPIDE